MKRFKKDDFYAIKAYFTTNKDKISLNELQEKISELERIGRKYAFPIILNMSKREETSRKVRNSLFFLFLLSSGGFIKSYFLNTSSIDYKETGIYMMYVFSFLAIISLIFFFVKLFSLRNFIEYKNSFSDDYSNTLKQMKMKERAIQNNILL